MIEGTNQVVVLVGGVLAILATLAGGWFKWGRPRAQQTAAVSEAILGRPEVTDRSGAVIQPAQAGMVAQVSELKIEVRTLVDTHLLVRGVVQDIKDVKERVKVLEDARVEHVVSRAESAAAFSAIEAAVKATPEQESP